MNQGYCLTSQLVESHLSTDSTTPSVAPDANHETWEWEMESRVVRSLSRCPRFSAVFGPKHGNISTVNELGERAHDCMPQMAVTVHMS